MFPLYTGNNRSAKDKEDKVVWREDGEEEVKDKAKKSRKKKFLARLKKPWTRIVELKWRGTYVIREVSPDEVPGPSPISRVDGREKKEEGEGDNDMTEAIEKMLDIYRSVTDSSSDSGSLTLHEILHEELSSSTLTPERSFFTCQEEKSTTSDISLEEPGTCKDPSSGTAPLSLASFTFHRFLGKGGFGQVFMATDIIRKESVAIKVVTKSSFTGLGCSFIERHVLQLSHESPYLIHGLAAFHTLSHIYYVMELATRGDLYEFMVKNFPLDPATVKFLTAEVVCGTQFLHGKGILHRDLKPENILLTREGHIKITDFGLAVTSELPRNRYKCKGTRGYAAPEMVKGRAHGRGVDFFAIGVILYELLTKKIPPPGKCAKDIENSLPFMTKVFLEPGTIHIIEGLLCKDQFQRLGVKGDIRKHLYFSDINWEDVEARRMAPPRFMDIFMAGSDDLNIQDSLDIAELLTEDRCEHQEIFNLFSFVCPEWSKQYHPVTIEAKTPLESQESQCSMDKTDRASISRSKLSKSLPNYPSHFPSSSIPKLTA